MPALVAGIHVLPNPPIKDVDGRDEPGHDGVFYLTAARASRGYAATYGGAC
jgi:hypothetical protein